jgi:putative nucleotidyltransferase with HDIG domain
MISREECIGLVRQNVKNENLVNHVIAVGAIMRALPVRFGKDQDLWEAVGILHDVDYEIFGDDFSKHGAVSADMVQSLLPEDTVNAIKRHNPLTGHEPETRFDISLLTADAMSEIIVANALVRPTKLEGMKPRSIRGRMKDKSFARQVSRETIMRCEKIGLPFNEFAAIAVKAMQGIAEEIGLS